MVPFLSMLQNWDLSLRDAEAAGRQEMALAVRRCNRCTEKTVCVQWLEWQGRDGRAPRCTNASYFAELKALTRPGVRARI